MSETILLRPTKKVGGWLIALIIWLLLWVPLGAEYAVRDCDKFFGSLGERFEFLHAWVMWLLWSGAFAGVYCAWLIGSRKAGAIRVTKVGVIFIASSQLLVDALVIPLGRPEVNSALVAQCVKPLFWFAVWYTYLVRSKRVKETYVS